MPEAGKIAGDLNRASGRGKQTELQRDAVFADYRMGVDGVEFLNDDVNGWLDSGIVDRKGAAGWCGERFRTEAVKFIESFPIYGIADDVKKVVFP